jgi:hypothetical protein
MSIDVAAMNAALTPTRVGLDAAGFDLSIAEVGGKLQMAVTARPEACEDCLVPKSLFLQMASDEVRDAGLSAVEMEVLYPIDARRPR